jgi:hypothetical protein
MCAVRMRLNSFKPKSITSPYRALQLYRMVSVHLLGHPVANSEVTTAVKETHYS